MRPIEGKGFAFVPRDVVAQPKAFGLAPGLLDPAEDVDVTSERYRAAMLQHVMASTARAALLKTKGIAPSVFAERFSERGLGADRVRRIFRGETMAQLTDVMFWSAHFPDVARALAEQTDEWFGAAEPPAEHPDAMRGDAPVSAPPETSLRMAVLRERVAASKLGSTAPSVRRTPQHPFA